MLKGNRGFFFIRELDGTEMKIHSNFILKCTLYRRNKKEMIIVTITKEILFVFFWFQLRH